MKSQFKYPPTKLVGKHLRRYLWVSPLLSVHVRAQGASKVYKKWAKASYLQPITGFTESLTIQVPVVPCRQVWGQESWCGWKPRGQAPAYLRTGTSTSENWHLCQEVSVRKLLPRHKPFRSASFGKQKPGWVESAANISLGQNKTISRAWESKGSMDRLEDF